MRTLLLDISQDLRFSARTLARNPAFTIAAVLALALGIGANTAIFSVVNAVALRPFPWKDSGRLVRIWESAPQLGWPRFSTSIPNFIDWRAQNHVYEDIAAWRGAELNLTGLEEAQRVEGGAVTASFFTTLGVQPSRGRFFLPDEEKPGADARVAVISHGLWTRSFGADPKIVGRTLVLNGADSTVVGVLPESFQWVLPSDILVPLVLDPAANRSNHVLIVMGRLRPGVTLERADAEMNGIAARLAAQYPDSNKGWSTQQAQVARWIVNRDVRRALLVLTAAVGFVLLIACANVTNLLLARAAGRRREIAIRAALGAGRMRVVRQLLTESALVGLAGGGAGLLLALWGVDLLRSLNPQTIPRIDEVSVDLRVLAFTLGLSLLTSLVFGLAPALQSSRPDVADALKEGGRGAPTGSMRHRARSALVTAEVAFSLVLLVGAGLLLRSFWRLTRVDPGFAPAGVVTMKINLPESKYPSAGEIQTFYEALFARLRAHPGVAGVATVSIVPFGYGNTANEVVIEGRPDDPGGAKASADWRLVSPGYFRAMGIPLHEGRDFESRDGAGPGVVVVSEAMARRYWPGADPIGKRMRPRGGKDWMTVVGVAGDVAHRGLDEAPAPLLYFCAYSSNWNPMSLVVRTGSDPASVTTAARDAVHALDRDLPVSEVSTLESLRDASVAPQHFNTLLLALFAVLALTLASVGIYGVMAYAVSQRTHEIGIRMALGSPRRDVLRLIVAQAMRPTLAGIVLGLTAALAATRLMQSLLFGVSPRDPVTFLAVAAILVAVALAACLVPARRASRVDPMTALRYE